MVNFSAVVQRARNAFASGKTKDVAFRKKQLLALINMLEKEADGFCQALYKDLRKHKHESLNMEVNLTKNDAVLAYNRLDEWMKPEKVKKNLLTLSDDCYIHREPLGVTLIIGAWNYPVQLVLLPLIGAIAAGNCAIVKPSEVAEATAEFMAEVIPRYLDTECYHVVNGGIPETTALLAERWDLIFYTGNNTVAKIVYEAAAKHLTPVILELGGKSPVFVDETSDLRIAARRIAWGKFVNTGQTCIAPDYIMCTPQVQEKLLVQMKEVLQGFYGDDAQKSDSLGRIINTRHFSRIKGLIGDSNVAIGGRLDEGQKYIEPTILRDVKQTDPSMKDEIFGPVLPIMTVKNEIDAIDIINQGEKPLAMYIFSKNKKQVEKIINSTSSGGVTVNDTVMHASLPTLPFGGVGHSGTGSYHGKFSFDAFCHKRGIMARPQALEKVNDLRCPPYSEKKSNLIGWVMKKPIKSSGSGFIKGIFGFVKLVVFGVFIGFLAKQAGLDKYLPESLK